MKDRTTREQFLARKGALWTERQSWVSHWQEISQYLLPRTGRFLTAATQVNRGDKRHNNIYDSEATYAHGVLTAGLMAGTSSPARPWFRLATPDRDLNEVQSVKLWLDETANAMRDVFARSNTYRALHTLYEELAAYGTGVNVVVPNFHRVIHNYPLTAGQYAITTNEFDEVDTLYREIEMTVAQIVGRFVKQPNGSMDWSIASAFIKNAWDGGRALDAWVPVIHAVEPRREREANRRDSKNMPFRSVYFETGGNEDKFLSDSGYRKFPALCPRWRTSGGDIYGSSPAMDTLGDIKQLQHQQLRKAQGIDYMTKPPLQAPTSMKNVDINTLPGGVSYVDAASPQTGLRSAFEVQLDLSHLLADIQDVRQRISRNFYVDLFLMLANDDRSDITAREIAERHEEKMLMLGPVLERLQDELHKPLVDIAFDSLIQANALPTPPDELRGVDLNVEFISVLAQAQRAVGTSSVDRLLGTVSAIAAVKPDIVDKIDTDELVDRYADMLGVPPQLIVANEQVAIVRKQRQQAAAAMAKAQVVEQGAAAAKNLSQADTEGKNALTDLTSQFSGYAIPQGA